MHSHNNIKQPNNGFHPTRFALLRSPTGTQFWRVFSTSESFMDCACGRVKPNVSPTCPDSQLPPPLHAPENSHVASVPSDSNTRPAHPKAAIRIPSSAGPTHPMVSVPSSMIASRLLAPLRVGVATLRVARGVVGLGGTRRVGVGQGVAVSCGSAPASQSAAAVWRMISPLTHPTF